jgi:hypothetical protein
MIVQMFPGLSNGVIGYLLNLSVRARKTNGKGKWPEYGAHNRPKGYAGTSFIRDKAEQNCKGDADQGSNDESSHLASLFLFGLLSACTLEYALAMWPLHRLTYSWAGSSMLR